MAAFEAFAELPDDVVANIAKWAASDGRGFAGSSKRLLKAVRARPGCLLGAACNSSCCGFTVICIQSGGAATLYLCTCMCAMAGKSPPL
jgi:hypothetical protein